MEAVPSWTDERVELLRRLWDEGLSASQIASQIGGISRNAVIGKVHRLGLARRVKPAAGAAMAAPLNGRGKKGEALPPEPAIEAKIPEEPTLPEPPAIVSHRPAPDFPPPVQPLKAAEPVALAVSERVTIMDLRESMCRWPMGDPTSPDFRFCGGRAITGLPYCTHHAQIAYQPAAERRRDRRVAGFR